MALWPRLGSTAIAWSYNNGNYEAKLYDNHLGLVTYHPKGDAKAGQWTAAMKTPGGGLIVIGPFTSAVEGIIAVESAYAKRLSWWQWAFLFRLAGQYSKS